MKNGKYCILIADDEKEIRDILRLLLEGEGYAVLTAEDGREAIAEAAAEVDLYYLDSLRRRKFASTLMRRLFF